MRHLLMKLTLGMLLSSTAAACTLRVEDVDTGQAPIEAEGEVAGAACSVTTLEHFGDISDPDALDTVLARYPAAIRRYASDEVAVAFREALRSALQDLPKEAYPLSIFNLGVSTDETALDITTINKSYKLGRSWKALRRYPVYAEPRADGSRVGLVPLLFYKERAITRAESGGDGSLEVVVRCAETKGAPTSKRTIQFHVQEDTACPTLSDPSDLVGLCGGGCNGAKNVTRAEVDWSRAPVQHRYSERDVEMRQIVECACSDGASFEATCNGGLG